MLMAEPRAAVFRSVLAERLKHFDELNFLTTFQF